MPEVKISKSKIIKKALLKLNEPFDDEYLEEDSSYKTANFLLDGLLENMLSLATFYFNLKPAILSQSTLSTENKYIYNKPKDYLGLFQSNHPVNEIGDKFYCDYPNLEITYKANLDISELPVQAENYLVLKLAYDLAGPINKEEMTNKIFREMELEKNKLEALGGPTTSDPYSEYNNKRGLF